MINRDATMQKNSRLYKHWKIIKLMKKIKVNENDIINLKFLASWLPDLAIKIFLNFTNQHKSLGQIEIDCSLKLYKEARLYLIQSKKSVLKSLTFGTWKWT